MANEPIDDYRNTSLSFLMIKEGESYAKLIDVIELPDLGKAPDQLDTTTLTDTSATSINDIQKPDGFECSAYYTPAGFKKLEALAGEQHDFAVWLGGTETAGTVVPDGSFGKFEFSGELAVWKKAAAVSGVHQMGIKIALSTKFTPVFD